MAEFSRPDWLRQARAVLAEYYGPQTGGLTVRVFNDEGQTITFDLPADDLRQIQLPALSPIEADIVRVLGNSALKGPAIARRMGLDCNGSLKTLLANLVGRGVLTNTSTEGYKLARPPEPTRQEGPT